MGTVNEAVPVARLVENFSSMPRIAPPPLGSDSVGAIGTALGVLPDDDLGAGSLAPLPSVVDRDSSTARRCAIALSWIAHHYKGTCSRTIDDRNIGVNTKRPDTSQKQVLRFSDELPPHDWTCVAIKQIR